MKGDFSRRTFDPAKTYSAVLPEQGRMLTDADLDEEHRILAHRIETEAGDLIGGHGGPIGAAGFEITDDGGEPLIGAGRYYVAGILAANQEPVSLTGQPAPPATVWPPAGGAGRYLVYLDVWRRLITALDDTSIREVALGGPTTAVREQTVWQVGLAAADAAATCASPLPDPGGTTGRLAAQANPEAASTDPCEVPPSAGFKGLENQLYRVEIHATGDAYDLTAAPDVFAISGFPAGTTDQVTLADATGLDPGHAVEIYRTGAGSDPREAAFAHIAGIDGTTVTLTTDLPGFAPADAPHLRRVGATFVWSRENGSVVTAVERIDGNEITVGDLGLDEVLGFAPGQWVEISDDRNEWETRPGQLARIDAVDAARRVLVLKTPIAPLDTTADGPGIDPSLHPKCRRWDGAGAVRVNNPPPGDDWIHLEEGVQVRFTTGRYRAGDYWHFPARTATANLVSGHIEWPADDAGNPALPPPHGVAHHRCRLALIDLTDDGDGGLTLGAITDCRDLFPPVTQLTNLLYVGGDGQEGLPDPAAPGSRDVALGVPLQVRVANGSHPVAGARVLFTITAGNGQLGTAVPVVTDPEGIARCDWRLDGATPHQVCEARLLDAAGDPLPHQAVNFTASLSQAARVAYDPAACSNLANASTVQEAIDILCRREGGGGGRCCCVTVGPGAEFEEIRGALDALIERGERDLCLCLLPGDHQLDGLDVGGEEPERGWHLSIAGCGPATRLDLLGDLRVAGLAGFTLRGLDIAISEGGTIHATQCRQVVVDQCHLSGLQPELGLVRIHFASSVFIGNSIFESFREPNLGEAINFFDGFDELIQLYATQPWREFERMARELAIDLARRDPRDRAAMADELRGRLERVIASISTGEEAAYRRFIEALGREEEVDPLALLDHLIAIRRAVLRLNPGIALELGELVPGAETEFSAAGTRDGAARIEGNDISGLVSFYGAGAPDREINPETFGRLRVLLQRGAVSFRGLDLAVHLRNNRLTRCIVAEPLIDAIERFVESPQGGLDVLLSNVHGTDNIIEGAGSQLVARHLVLTSNEFSLSAVRPRPGVFRGGEPVRVAAVVADSSIYTGNHGARFGARGLFAAQLFNAARATAEAANLEVTFV